MRTVAFIAVFVVLAGVYCGGSKPAAPVANWPAEATSALAEESMASFVKALPAFSAALKAASWQPPQPVEGDNPVGYLTRLVEGMNVPGVDDSLKAFGGWAQLRPTLYKVFAAMSALQIGSVPSEQIEQMRKDTSAAAKKGMKDFESAKAAFSQIPEANKQMLVSHEAELQALQTLGR
jgi:hypothetical protein